VKRAFRLYRRVRRGRRGRRSRSGHGVLRPLSVLRQMLPRRRRLHLLRVPPVRRRRRVEEGRNSAGGGNLLALEAGEEDRERERATAFILLLHVRFCRRIKAYSDNAGWPERSTPFHFLPPRRPFALTAFRRYGPARGKGTAVALRHLTRPPSRRAFPTVALNPLPDQKVSQNRSARERGRAPSRTRASRP